uniref:Uncharacterized protein n=1 Tax=Anguilla anguilla TaxID=7936 RepID=A0A0E9WLG3_ANGAN
MAMKSPTSMRMMSPMKSHLNLRRTMNFMVLQGFVNQKKDVSGRLGGSSFGFMLGSSLPFPAGFSSESFSVTISRVISTFPPNSLFPSFSIMHGHQPLTDF